MNTVCWLRGAQKHRGELSACYLLYVAITRRNQFNTKRGRHDLVINIEEKTLGDIWRSFIGQAVVWAAENGVSIKYPDLMGVKSR
jgi:hypothetical protein